MSNRRHKPVQHSFLPGLVKVDRQLVALDRGHVSVAELHVEHPVAHAERRGCVGDGFGDQFALDGAALDGAAAGAVGGVGFAVADALDRVAGAGAPVAVGGLRLVGLGAGPAGGGVGVGEGAAARPARTDIVEARGAVGVLATAAAAAGREGAAIAAVG